MNPNTRKQLDKSILDKTEVDFLIGYSFSIRQIELTDKEISNYHSLLDRYQYYYGENYASSLMAISDYMITLNRDVKQIN